MTRAALVLLVLASAPRGPGLAPAPPAAAAAQAPAPSSPGTRAAPPTSGTAAALRVRQVIDGDTITVAGVGTVRLLGVDAPEKTGGYREPEPFGEDAARFMRRLVEGRIVRLEYDGARRDQYNRTLAYVFLEDGTLVNEAIIRAGLAEVYRRFDFRRKRDFQDAEREARAARRGMWARRP